MSTIHHFETQIARIYDHLYANADDRTPEAIEREVLKILEAGVYLETNKNPLNYAFSFEPHEYKALEGNTDALKALAQYVRDAYVSHIERKDDSVVKATINLSDYDLIYCCKQLEGVSLNTTDRDVFGDAVELFRSHWSKYQGGQFFTDQRVTDLAITLLDYKGGGKQSLVDLCAGTGGFLLSAVKSQRVKLRSKVFYHNLFGFEVDQAVAKIGNQSLRVINGCKADRITVQNSLISVPKESFTHAATNPPFGAKIKVKDPDVLRNFSLARQRSSGQLKPLPLDILFIEKNYEVLKDGGKLAIVLPFQTLSGPQAKWVREWMFERFKLLGVIDLPGDTFQPYTGTKGSLLLLQKSNGGVSKQKEAIFMSCPKHIGHDRRGNPTWKKDKFGKETGDLLTDFPDVEQDLKLWKVKGMSTGGISKISFSISVTELEKSVDFRIDAHYFQPSELSSATGKLENNTSFKKVLLKDLCETIFYPGRFKRNYTDATEGSVPFLGGTNISQLLLITDTRLSTGDKNYQELRVSSGWLLMTRSGSTGIVSIVPEAWDGFAISEHVIRIVPSPGSVDHNYLFAYLNTAYAKSYIRKGVFGSVIDELSPEYIGNLPVFIPTKKSQLSAIEDLVRNGLASRNSAIDSLDKASDQLGQILALGSQ